jgi:hypothetical protein
VIFGVLFFGLLQVSPAVCQPCHSGQTEGFAQAGMTLSLDSGNSAILRSHAPLATRIGGYSYRVDGSTYSVSDGSGTLHFTLEWSFGKGTIGQTWLFRDNGRWYEARVSYYSKTQGLDVTIGQQSITPRNLREAAGRTVAPDELKKCFDCHATKVRLSGHQDLTSIIPGVQCERCHGPTEAHLTSSATMRKLGALTPEEMSDFCGQCHRTWSQVSLNGPRGVQNVRFQPYRLALSRCYDAADNRIRCTACHDPHHAIATSSAAYDVKCQACHSLNACKVGVKNCSGCHMPKVDLPGAHTSFTDHRIRIAKADEPYPD